MGLKSFFTSDRHGNATGEHRTLRTLDATPAPARTKTHWLVGLDLGELADYSALAIVERQAAPPAAAQYAVRYLQRWPLRTAYPTVVAEVVALWRRPPLSGAAPVLADATGVGLPVTELLAPALGGLLTPVLITAGSQATRDGPRWHVAKHLLVSTLQVVLQTGRLRVAPSLPEAATLRTELAGFQQRVTGAANLQYGTWRDGAHDDIVLAVALAVWWGEHGFLEQHWW
jgi:hypothetical protein